MKKSSYKSAMSKLKTSEDFQERALERLNLERHKQIENDNRNEETPMRTVNPAVKKNKVAIWTASIAACAVLTLSIYAVNQNNSGTAHDPVTNKPSGGVVENN